MSQGVLARLQVRHRLVISAEATHDSCTSMKEDDDQTGIQAASQSSKPVFIRATDQSQHRMFNEWRKLLIMHARTASKPSCSQQRQRKQGSIPEEKGSTLLVPQTMRQAIRQITVMRRMHSARNMESCKANRRHGLSDNSAVRDDWQLLDTTIAR